MPLVRALLVLPLPAIGLAWFIAEVTENGPGCGTGSASEGELYAIGYLAILVSLGAIAAGLFYAVTGERLKLLGQLCALIVVAFIASAFVYYGGGCGG